MPQKDIPKGSVGFTEGPPVPVRPAQAVAEPPKPVAPAAPDGVPEIVVNATKLKEIVDYLQAQGHKTVGAILAEIERLKPHSPVLQRATDVEPRVKKMLSVVE
jgi:hypothetical protein